MPSDVRHSRFGSILCPIDFSDQSASALRHAAALARRAHGKLTALFVVDPLLSAAAAAAYDARALERTSREELTRFVKAALPGRSDVRCLTAVGKSAPTILDTAHRRRSDVIVLGTHGLSGVRKAFFGSTTEKVLKSSDVPVLAVPAACKAPGRGWPSGPILAAVDLEPPDSGIPAVFDAARTFSSELTVAHAVAEAPTPPWLSANQQEDNRVRVNEARRRLQSQVVSAPRGLDVELKIVVGDPPETIARLATKQHADLLILTLRRPSRPLHHHGTTAYRILRFAQIPVLAIPIAAGAARRRRRG